MGIISSNLSPQLMFMPDQQTLETCFGIKKNPEKPTRQHSRARKKSQGTVQQMALPFLSEPHHLSGTALVASTFTSGLNTENITTGSRLRVVREFDSAISPSCAGRMVISGRMADVCAELERLSHALNG